MSVTKKWVFFIGLIMVGLILGSVVIAQDQVIQPPKEKEIAIQTNQEGKDYTFIFRGGAGQSQVKHIGIELIAPDGTVQTAELSPERVGNEIVMTGTGCGDRVRITVTFMDGYYYVISDEVMQVLSAICDTNRYVASNPCEGTSASSYMQPGDIERIPDGMDVAIQANPEMNTLEVQFRGGFGQGLISSIDLDFIQPDGTHEVKKLGNTVGEEATFVSTQCIGRLVATVHFMDGTSYRFYDNLIDFVIRTS